MHAIGLFHPKVNKVAHSAMPINGRLAAGHVSLDMSAASNSPHYTAFAEHGNISTMMHTAKCVC
jgi:hypothetical protein